MIPKVPNMDTLGKSMKIHKINVFIYFKYLPMFLLLAIVFSMYSLPRNSRIQVVVNKF